MIVLGAGLAGLSAARRLEQRGASVTVVEARDRVGGRVVTLRGAFADRQTAEGGADLIEHSQQHVLGLSRELGLETVRILRSGFGFYGPDSRGRRSIQTGSRAFSSIGKSMAPLVREFQLVQRRWDSAVGMVVARRSVAQWLDGIKAPEDLRARLRGFRGFFLADPEDLSLLPVVEQFADWDTPGREAMYRIVGGNDRLATGLARRLRGRVLLRTIARRIAQRAAGVSVTIEDAGGQQSELSGHFVVCALPASTARDLTFDPALPEPQRDAIARLRYGCATRLVLQFERRFWMKVGRPRAYGTDLPTGAVWDGNEHQRGPRGILVFLAGGRASAALQRMLEQGGGRAVIRELRWMGEPSRLVASRTIVWENDPWAKGGYAYFDPGFDPLWREWLARPAGRILFAGEHTSVQYQGYMNGAIESGLRAAAEVSALRQWGDGENVPFTPSSPSSPPPRCRRAAPTSPGPAIPASRSTATRLPPDTSP